MARVQFCGQTDRGLNFGSDVSHTCGLRISVMSLPPLFWGRHYVATCTDLQGKGFGTGFKSWLCPLQTRWVVLRYLTPLCLSSHFYKSDAYPIIFLAILVDIHKMPSSACNSESIVSQFILLLSWGVKRIIYIKFFIKMYNKVII